MRKYSCLILVLAAVTFFFPLICVASDSGAHLGYSGAKGPANWGAHSPAYGTCTLGMNQSPVNIEPSATVKGETT